jgi:PAS domain S-box-containing protein
MENHIRFREFTVSPSAQGITIYGKDITQSKKAQEALEESEQLYHTMFDNTEDAFQLLKPVFDKSGIVSNLVLLKVNRAYENQIGLKASEVVGRSVTEYLPNLEPYWISFYGDVVRKGRAAHTENFNQSTNRWYDVYAFLYAKGQIGVLFRDITDRKSLEKELQDRERLVAIGQTAGMVGHDICNPLQAIVSELYLAREAMTGQPHSNFIERAIDSINFVEEQVDYISKIIADLQDYSRTTNPTLSTVNAQKIIDEAFSSITIPANIEAKCIVEPNLEVKSDPSYLRRIITNLSTNAIQAMPNGKKLTIEVQKRENLVEINVKDTGEGIPENLRDKMFKPLFTTKAKGQGFGLAVVKKFVEQLGGTIAFESQEGKGTTFKIELPINS